MNIQNIFWLIVALQIGCLFGADDRSDLVDRNKKDALYSVQIASPFADLPLELQWNISKYALSGDVKRDLFDRSLALTLSHHEGWILSVSFNEKGIQVVSRRSGTIYIWDIKTGNRVRLLNASRDYKPRVSFNEKGTQIVVTSQYTGPPLSIADVLGVGPYRPCPTHYETLLQIWDVKTSDDVIDQLFNTAKMVHQLHVYGHVDSISFNREGTQVVCSTGGRVCIWDIATGELIRLSRDHTDLIRSASFKKNGKQAGFDKSGQTVRIWHQPLDYAKYDFSIAQALWIQTKYHECMHDENAGHREHADEGILQNAASWVVQRLYGSQSQATVSQLLNQQHFLNQQPEVDSGQRFNIPQEITTRLALLKAMRDRKEL